MSKINKLVKILGIVMLIALIGFSAYSFLSKGKVAQAQHNPKDQQQQLPNKETRIENGVQIAELSWGKFNYKPEVITVKSGMPVKIIGDTERLQGCFRSFVIPELNVQKRFSENNNAIEFTPTKTGSFYFGCSMGMGRGTLVVE